MGVLEDAIREHLELKRQHGASEEEVERQETEVLGEARRRAAEAEAGEEAAAEEPGAAGEEQPAAEEPVAAEPFEETTRTAADDAPDTEESEAPLAAEPRSVGDIFAADAPADPSEEPFDPTIDEEEPPPRAFADDPPRGETVTFEDFVQFDEVEPGSAPPMPAHEEERPAPGAEGDDPESEDMLEETPEFLQETPEHDRLWFEQKPPRDFDFD